MTKESTAGLIVVGPLVVVALAMLALSRVPAQTEVETSAIVIRLGMTSSRWAPGMITVVAQTADGRIGEETAALSRLRCRVGDSVSARSVGVSLHIDLSTCARPPPTAARSGGR
jgi:hypothetical protein